MQCPVCPDTTLTMTHREGIEIDYCPRCRGVWLDRGELDKIIERTAGVAASPTGTRYPPGGYDDDDYRKYHGKRKRGLLGELFDFD